LEIYEKYLRESKRLVSSWGEKIYMIYFPTCAIIKYNQSYNNIDSNIFDIIRMLNISIIDVESEVFENHLDPMSLFPFRAHKNNINELEKRIDNIEKDK
jgi:hypothetical protein|tara:strand:- start:105 stop:401 length:297 start_codon:yes stop_codon:yes gene_type:complete